MPKGELYIKKHADDDITIVNNSMKTINGQDWIDAFLQWGVSFSETGLSSLMTPAPNKPPVENKSRAEHGKVTITGKQWVKKDERDVTVEMHIVAVNKSDFWDKYDRFCSEVLDYGYIELMNGYVPTKVFRMNYQNCTQFSEFMQEMAKFSLRLNEPDPSNRAF